MENRQKVIEVRKVNLRRTTKAFLIGLVLITSPVYIKLIAIGMLSLSRILRKNPEYAEAIDCFYERVANLMEDISDKYAEIAAKSKSEKEVIEPETYTEGEELWDEKTRRMMAETQREWDLYNAKTWEEYARISGVNDPYNIVARANKKNQKGGKHLL